ncbi:BREX-3 system phosphatase PglZ [Pseudomonadota bacterium]
MSNESWRQQILTEIDGRVSQCFVAEDPDGLLAEEDLQSELISRGFEVYFYEDPIELRFFLEEHVSADQRGFCVISVNTDVYNVDELPFDILSRSKRLSMSLGECFPGIHPEVLKALQLDELNDLDKALAQNAPGKLSELASCDFVLRHVYKLAPEIIQSPSDLMRSLLMLHYQNLQLPNVMQARLVSLLAKRHHLLNWPLEQTIASKKGFLVFLQAHWATYVENVAAAAESGVREELDTYGVDAAEGDTPVLPFGHDDVRVYIDNLFIEGFLDPIEVADSHRLVGHWCLVGVLQDAEEDLKRRYSGLAERCAETLPKESGRYQEWLQYAYRWAELSALHHVNKDVFVDNSYGLLQSKTDEAFSAWLIEKYGGLHNHPPTPPVMLHHIPRAMARDVDKSLSSKSALILIDGLAINQWVTINKYLSIEGSVNEAAVFAWVPTLTSVSRQALFSAKAPYQFAKSINTTNNEPKEWQQFWADHGLDKNEVFYAKSLGTDDIDTLLDRLSDHRLRAIGLVINTVDDMMHGMQLGAAGMHNQISLWAESGYLQKLIDSLLERGFLIHVTSDHGNVEAIGSGKVNEGAVAESRGERARIYETEMLRESVVFRSSEAVAWHSGGLPSDYLPVVMKGREAFVAEGKKIVAHGGISIEEVIVPYITISGEENE